MISGIVLVDKPQSPTSHQVVAIARRALGVKKIGHAGTLDPMASGLMTLGVGPSTRLLTFLVGLDKTYRATIRLGYPTTTDDAWGELVGQRADASALDGLTEQQIRDTLARSVGEVWQRPSSVSAIKVDGQRAYDRVRRGEEVDLPARRVVIHRIDVDRVWREDGLWQVECEVECSSGTYIRAIARDLGEALGVGGHLTALRRLAVGPWSVDDAVSPDDITSEAVRDPGEVISQVLPTVTVDRAATVELSHGKKILVPNPPEVAGDQPVAVIGDAGKLFAIVSGLPGPLRILVGFPGGEAQP